MPAVTWTTFVVGDLNTAKAAPLVDALRTAALAVGQPDPVPGIITDVIARIRMEIEAGGRSVLSADISLLPPSLKRVAMRMALREAQSRLNAAGALPLSEDEIREEKNDLRLLERIAKGELTVEESDAPASSTTVQSASPSPLISASDREWTRDSQDGI